MGMLRWAMFGLVSLYPLFSCDVSATSTQLMSNKTQDDFFNICDVVYCGKGTCSSTGVLSFTCNCESGWKKPKFGSVEFPACVFPNCTVNVNFGNNGSPPAAPALEAPCLVNYCGYGTCVTLGDSDFKCQCNQGSDNLLNDPKLVCLNKLSLGGDCNGLDLGGFGSESPPPPATSEGTASPGTSGSRKRVSCIREVLMVGMTILALIFQIWS